MNLSRRGFLIGSGAAALALAAGCASDDGGGTQQAAPEEKAQLTFWTFLDNTAEVAKWNAKNPAIQVKAENVPAQDYYAKLQAAVKAGNAPDIALVEYQFLPTMVAAGALADLTGKVSGDLQGRFPAAHSGDLLADEAVTLGSAFQLAGFRHVVASLWPLSDRIAADAARAFYRLVPGRTGADGAAEALRAVSLGLRDTYPDRPDLWASLVHSGA
ncbi:extracellular solute-binding protein [Amycolatopsis sp. OK19-0408]|uniref:Extracellular solute-binding protein n=1 Tax=Amycolatopsis iheyensis TaxID=2945988 RepID=A0A9X2SQW0_9PSEU|nr:extracellular solute-binding protein [Amycolatopsis iheyensis]MCR6489776.1 extracellular solute-binding protein [Amycolatopsis iheyensis]